MFYVTKTYGHECGLSACFRQWRAKSHCRFLHGYPLSFKFTFAASELDENGWVINFGGLKPLKSWLEEMFDHKLLVAKDDPQLERLEALMPYKTGIIHGGVRDGEPTRIYQLGDPEQLAQVRVVPAVGCEAFATMAWKRAQLLLVDDGLSGRVSLVEVEVREHGANSAIYAGEK